MKLWIARDMDGQLFLYRTEPRRCKNMFASTGSIVGIRLLKELFPEVTFENSPQEVELKLVKE